MNNNNLNFHQSKYKKEGNFTFDDLPEDSSVVYPSDASVNSQNDYVSLQNSKKRSTQNERLRTQKSALEHENSRLSAELSQYKNMMETERQKALDLQAQHLELTAQGAMEVGNTKALVGSIKDLVKTEAQRFSSVPTQTQTLPTQSVYNYSPQTYIETPVEENFYSAQQEANINKLLDKFTFLDPRRDNPSYSPDMFAQADQIQRDLLNEYKRQGRGDQEFSPEFTKNLEDRLNQHFNNNNNTSKSARMVAPVGGTGNFMMDSNIALQPEDIKLIQGFKNAFGEEFVDLATKSLKEYRMHPEETTKRTLNKEMMYNPFNQNL